MSWASGGGIGAVAFEIISRKSQTWNDSHILEGQQRVGNVDNLKLDMNLLKLLSQTPMGILLNSQFPPFPFDSRILRQKEKLAVLC